MKLRISITLFFLIVSTGISVLFFIRAMIPLAILFSGITIFLFFHILYQINKIFQEVQSFDESITVLDLSKKYSEKIIRKNKIYGHFNHITDAFLSLNREKEAQQHYLKKILELVDTGILAYDTDSYETIWMNDAIGNMLDIPNLKNINWLKNKNEVLYNELLNIPLGERKLISINTGKQTIKVLTNASNFQTAGKNYKLIAFHNVNNALEEVEASAWKGLLNVMTHEIMNSIAPVSSLADTLKKRIGQIKNEKVNEHSPDFEDIEFAMETIHRRSEGLLQFADTYRSLNKKISLELKSTNIYELISSVHQLMNPSLKQKGILLETRTNDPSVTVTLDRGLIEQVLINFITNATYAVRDKENPVIILSSGIAIDGNTYITVADNGCGIPEDIRDKIFIPFFSTKKQGSGIGLSLSREIVKLHKGNIHVQSKEDEGSAFSILFKTKE